MNVTDFIAAIELGSAKVKGVVGRLNADKSVQILATAEVASDEFIKKGAIFNLDKTTQCIHAVISNLESQIGDDIAKVYVGIGGRSLRVMKVTEERELASDTKISQALIDTLLAENKERISPDLEILWTEPQEYKVGNNLLPSPVGVQADKVTATYVNVVARRTLKQNILSCLKQLPYELAGFYLSPLATTESLLSESDRRSGCALVDIGAETTTVVVYSGNILRHLAVLPLGSRNLTRDIMSQKIEEDDAEAFKLKFGSAYTPLSDDVDYARAEHSLENGTSIRALVLEEIIEGRINELIYNVDNQLILSEYKDKLLSGVVVTGGCANLPKLKDVFEKITKISRVRIALGSIIAGSDSIEEDGTHNTLIGAIMLGKENCRKIVVPTNIFDAATEDERRAKDMARRAAEVAAETEAKAAAKAAAEARKKADEEAARIKAEQERKAQEEADRKLRACNILIDELKEQMEAKNLKAAGKTLQKLQKQAPKEKEEEVAQLAKDLKRIKEEGHWTHTFKTKVEIMLTKIMGDGDEEYNDNQAKRK